MSPEHGPVSGRAGGGPQRQHAHASPPAGLGETREPSGLRAACGPEHVGSTRAVHQLVTSSLFQRRPRGQRRELAHRCWHLRSPGWRSVVGAKGEASGIPPPPAVHAVFLTASRDTVTHAVSQALLALSARQALSSGPQALSHWLCVLGAPSQKQEAAVRPAGGPARATGSRVVGRPSLGSPPSGPAPMSVHLSCSSDPLGV